jgi:hypothetical protein
MKNNIAVLCIALSLSGCASVGNSILFGAGVGAAGGAGAGLLVQKSAGSALIGAGIGGVIGGALGYLFRQKKSDSGSTAINEKELPYIKKPEANCTHLEGRIEGPIWYGPQIKCTIDNPAVWSK